MNAVLLRFSNFIKSRIVLQVPVTSPHPATCTRVYTTIITTIIAYSLTDLGNKIQVMSIHVKINTLHAITQVLNYYLQNFILQGTSMGFYIYMVINDTCTFNTSHCKFMYIYVK